MSASSVVPLHAEPVRRAAAPEDAPDNPVRRTIDELRRLAAAGEELRASLAAAGVPRRVVNVLVELGVQKQPERQREAVDGALEQAERAQGAGSIDRETLEERLAELVRVEQDVDHARQVARGLGLDPRALAVLSQLIQSNPGDGGERAVNRLLAYARACGIPLDGVPAMAAELTAPPPSVLPRIARRPRTPPRPSARELARDALIGLAIGVLVIAALV